METNKPSNRKDFKVKSKKSNTSMGDAFYYKDFVDFDSAAVMAEQFESHHIVPDGNTQAIDSVKQMRSDENAERNWYLKRNGVDMSGK